MAQAGGIDKPGRRQLRLHDLKRFDDPWSPACWSRLGALEAVLPCDPDSALNLGSCPAGR